MFYGPELTKNLEGTVMLPDIERTLLKNNLVYGNFTKRMRRYKL